MHLLNQVHALPFLYEAKSPKPFQDLVSLKYYLKFSFGNFKHTTK